MKNKFALFNNIGAISLVFFVLIETNIIHAQDITRYSPNRNYSEMTLLVANNVKTIIANGKVKGRKLNRFMKIGDSMTKNSYSFGQFVCIDDTAKGGNHKPWEYVRKLDSYGYLYNAIEFFNQDTLPDPMQLEEAYYSENGIDYHYACKSYNRDSKAAVVGMSADWPLSDNPSPFAQEIADVNPAFAIIMYGANDAGGTGDDYTVFNKFANNIINLVDSCINRGIVPVLTASCANLNYFERTLAMSHITRCIAQGRQIPYVNFFRAAMPLPNNGVGGDGVHPEAYDYNKSGWLTTEALQYGYNMRNLITMQQMNNLYQVVSNNRSFIDDSTPAILGTGTSSDPYVIESLSFVDFKTTTSTNPSYYYKLTLNNALNFKGMICYRGTAMFNIELLNSSMASIATNAGIIEQNLSAGTYYIKLSTVSTNYGEFQFIALDADDSGMPIEENATPVIVNVTNAERCGTGSLTLEAEADKGTINWYAEATGGTALGSGNTFTTPEISSSTIYYVDATEGVLTSARTAVTATINNCATPVIVNVTNAERCGTGSLTLEADADKGTINWYAEATGGTALGSGNTFTTPEISSSTIYYVDATEGVLTSARTAVTATINNCTVTPVIVSVTNAERCGTGSLTLEAEADKGTINWYAEATGGTALGSGNTFTTPEISSSTIYYVDATEGVLTSAHTAVTATINNCTTTFDNPVIPVSVSVFPNPSNGIVNVVFTIENKDTYTIEVYNHIGCKVWNSVEPASINNLLLDLTEFSTGLYIIKVTSSKGIFTNKIMKY